MRGVSSSESAQIGGMGHLLSFKGTDNVEALEMIDEYYSEEMAGFSVNASEHSTVTSWGGPEFEKDAYKHLLAEFSLPNSIISSVSDSYDLHNACLNLYGGEFKEQIEALGNIGSKFVVRPDSGEPSIVVRDTIENLFSKFGYSVNSKGYRTLPPYLGVLQGDGINETSIRSILTTLQLAGISSECVVFGMGGALLQGVTRDTLSFAMKANEAVNETFNNGQPYPVFKQPKTDKTKSSKRGRQAVLNEKGEIFSVSEQVWLHNNNSSQYNLLEDVYVNGEIKRLDTFANMRARVEAAL